MTTHTLAATAAVDEAQPPPATDAAKNALPERRAHPIPEACQLLGGVSQATIYRWHSKGLIDLVKIGGRTFVPTAEISRLSGNAA